MVEKQQYFVLQLNGQVVRVEFFLYEYHLAFCLNNKRMIFISEKFVLIYLFVDLRNSLEIPDEVYVFRLSSTIDLLNRVNLHLDRNLIDVVHRFFVYLLNQFPPIVLHELIMARNLHEEVYVIVRQDVLFDPNY